MARRISRKCAYICRKVYIDYKELDELTLAKCCLRHDKLAEEELYRRYADRVYSLCRRYLGDDDEAKDLMLESLFAALDRIDTFRYNGEGSLYGWIRRIAVNKAIDLIRRHSLRTIHLDFWIQDNIPEPTEDRMKEIPSEKLREWIAELPKMRRTIFNLYCIDGYSHKEISRMLGISETGSTSVLVKARRQMKERIHKYLIEQDI